MEDKRRQLMNVAVAENGRESGGMPEEEEEGGRCVRDGKHRWPALSTQLEGINGVAPSPHTKCFFYR